MTDVAIEGCDGFCNDVHSLMTSSLYLDSISRARLSPPPFYQFDDSAIFQRCNNLMADVALQTRLMITVLNKKFNVPNDKLYKVGRKTIKLGKYDIQELKDNVGFDEIENKLTYEQQIALISYHINVARVKTNRKKLFVNLADTCSFIAHAEKSYFAPITSHCIGSNIVVHLSKNRRHKEHSMTDYDGRLYEICLSSFALCATSLFQLCESCGGEYGEIMLDKHGFPVWKQINDDDD